MNETRVDRRKGPSKSIARANPTQRLATVDTPVMGNIKVNQETVLGDMAPPRLTEKISIISKRGGEELEPVSEGVTTGSREVVRKLPNKGVVAQPYK
jgi:hypothetical protein